MAFVVYIALHQPAKPKAQAPASTPRTPTTAEQMENFKKISEQGEPDVQAGTKLLIVRRYIDLKNYQEALDLINKVRPNLKGSNIQVSYLLEAELYGRQNQLDKSSAVADAALKVPEIASSPTYVKQWNDLKAQYASGKNPYATEEEGR